MNDAILKGTYNGFQIFYDLYSCKYYTWYKANKYRYTSLDMLYKKIDSFKLK